MLSSSVNRVFTPKLVYALAIFNMEYGNAEGHKNLKLEDDVSNVMQAFEHLGIP